MARHHVSETPATASLRRAGIAFDEFTYDYVDHGGTAAAAAGIGVDEHAVVKTLVMQDEHARPFIVLMHGDRRVSTRNLARAISCKSVSACEPAVATRHTGYQVGGTSPFGCRKALPVYVERSVLELEHIYINGGRRGYLLGITPGVLARMLAPTPVACALEPR